MYREVYQGKHSEGGMVRDYGDYAIVESFSSEAPGVFYRIDEHGCDCPAARFGGNRRCKHRVLLTALQGVREVRFGRSIIETRITETARKVFRRVKGPESLRDSYDLMLDTFSDRYATDEMKTQAFRRHGRVIEMAERRVA